MIVEGLLPLVDREVRDAIDVAVFLEPEEDLRHRWKLERDVFERGYSPKEVVAELNRREPDAAQYIRPSAIYADIVVRFHRRDGATDDEHLSARLIVRPTLPFPALRELLGSFRARGVEPVRWSTRTDRRGPMSVLDIDGELPARRRRRAGGGPLGLRCTPTSRCGWDRIGGVPAPGGGRASGASRSRSPSS